MSRKPPPFLTFSISHQTYATNFTLDYHIRRIQQISQQYYPEDITHDDDQLSTKPIRQKRLEIMTMTVSEDITHDDDQLSTKTTQDDGIMEKESLFEDIVCYILYLIVGVLK